MVVLSIEARQIQETLYSYTAILNFTPSPQGLHAKIGACSVQNAQLLPRSILDQYTITGGAARHEKVKPKTWRILASADATWYLQLQVFTTDQPRCYAFDKVLPPSGCYRKKIVAFLFLGQIFKSRHAFVNLDSVLKCNVASVSGACENIFSQSYLPL